MTTPSTPFRRICRVCRNQFLLGVNERRQTCPDCRKLYVPTDTPSPEPSPEMMERARKLTDEKCPHLEYGGVSGRVMVRPRASACDTCLALAFSEVARERDDEWCLAIWPTNPEGEASIPPKEAAELIREGAILAVQFAAREARDAERERCANVVESEDGWSAVWTKRKYEPADDIDYFGTLAAIAVAIRSEPTE